MIEPVLLRALNWHVYECVECTRRFWDRPTHRPDSHLPAPPGDETKTPRAGRRKARPRFRVDAYPAAFRRYELYVTFGIGAALLMLLVAIIWLVWPESHRVLRGVD